MTIIKRADLGRPLTWDELDDNFQQVDDLTAAASAAVSSASASATAAASSAASSATSATDAANSAANAAAVIVSAVKSTITFTTGGTLNSNLDRISDGTYLYYWTGTYPITVPAGSTVVGTGGIAVGFWAVDNDQLLRNDLLSTSGGSLIGGLGYVTPHMKGATVGDSVTDNTTAVLAAITDAITNNKVLVLTGGPFRINQTLDLTNVKHVIADYTGRLLVNPNTFIPTHSRPFVVTFGNPDTAFGSNRCVQTTVDGYLVVESDNRDVALSGVYVKGALLKFGAIRAKGFNGHGFRADAWWDSVAASISVELCGNLTLHAMDLNPYGDTSNCLNIGRIQVEQAYHKQMNLNLLRCVLGPIHSERLKILTLDDGTTGLASGLTYQNTNISLTNCTVEQMILDAAKDTNAGTVTVTPSVRLNLYESTANSLYLGTSVVSVTFGQNGTINSSSFYKYYNPSYSVTMNACRVTRTALDGYLMVGGSGFAAYNCTFDTVQPDFGTSSALFNKCTINNTYSNTNTGVSGVLFDKCIFAVDVTSTGSTEAIAPTELRNCRIVGSLTGAFQHRVIVNGGYVTTCSLASRAYVEMNNVRGGTFNYTGDRAFTTINCSFTTVTAWGAPTFGAYKSGKRTQRIGTVASGSIIEYVNTTDAGATFTAAITLP